MEHVGLVFSSLDSSLRAGVFEPHSDAVFVLEQVVLVLKPTCSPISPSYWQYPRVIDSFVKEAGWDIKNLKQTNSSAICSFTFYSNMFLSAVTQ